MKALVRLGIFVLSVLIFAACSSGGGPGDSGPPGDSGGNDHAEFSIKLIADKSDTFFSESVNLTIELEGATADEVSVSWNAEDGELTETGRLTATWIAPEADGTFEVQASVTLGGDTLEETVRIRVEPDPTKNYLRVSAALADGKTTTIGKEVTLNARIIGPDKHSADIEWEIISGGLGTLSPDTGETVTWITGNAIGKNTFRVTATIGTEVLVEELELEIIVPLEIIGLSPTEPVVGLGSEIELEAILGGYYATDAIVRWRLGDGMLANPALVGHVSQTADDRVATYKAPHLHGTGKRPEDVSVEVQLRAGLPSGDHVTSWFEVPITVQLCNSGDDNNPNDPCAISNVYQLQGILSGLGNDAGHYIIEKDIDASATRNWTWQGGEGLILGGFDGTLDGQGHAIEDLYIYRQNPGPAGLFTILRGTVKNLNFVRPEIKGQSAGVLAGQIAPGSVVENVTVIEGEVTANTIVGGIIGGMMDPADTDGPIQLTNLAVQNSRVVLENVAGSGETLAGGVIGMIGGVTEASEMNFENSKIAVDYALVTGGITSILHESAYLSDSHVINSVINEHRGRSLLVGGAVGINSGKIESSHVSSARVMTGNLIQASLTGGFVAGNQGVIRHASVDSTEVITSGAGTNSNITAGFAGTNNNGIIEFSNVTNSEVFAEQAVAGFVYNNGSVDPTSHTDAVVRSSFVRDSLVEIIVDNPTSNSNSRAAGFAQYNADEIIDSGVTNTTVTGGADLHAGFVSKNSPTGKIERSFVFGPESSVLSKGNGAAGFVSDNQGSITDSYAVLEKVRGSNLVAGFVGMNYEHGTISRSYVLTEIEALGQSPLPRGFVGSNQDSAIIDHSFWGRYKTGADISPDGGIAITSLADFQNDALFIQQGWRFSDPNATWQMPSSTSGPGPHTPDLINNSRY